jgi:hypothetical protein
VKALQSKWLQGYFLATKKALLAIKKAALAIKKAALAIKKTFCRNRPGENV